MLYIRLSDDSSDEESVVVRKEKKLVRGRLYQKTNTQSKYKPDGNDCVGYVFGGGARGSISPPSPLPLVFWPPLGSALNPGKALLSSFQFQPST